MRMAVLKPGLLTSVQDLGRIGHQKHGVIVSGAMDAFALRVANLLVGNAEGEAALEITLMGPSLAVEDDVLVAVCGGDLSPAVDGEALPMWRPVFVKRGSVLTFGRCRSGCRAYLAVAGGLALPAVMGSRSTYLRAGIGGFRGRPLQAGDVLTGRPPSAEAALWMRRLGRAARDRPFAAPDWSVASDVRPLYRPHPVIRAVRGAQFGWFEEESRERFFSAPFAVSPQSDRMGYRLSGPELRLSERRELLSEAVAMGTVQVPPDGQPIVLMADRQTTGGYPKIAQVASVDLPVMAQVKPGEPVRFAEISLREAQALYLAREADMQVLKRAIAAKAREQEVR